MITKSRLLLGLIAGVAIPASSFGSVMMQGFYWDVTPQGGTGAGSYYALMQSKAAGLKNMAGGYGINRIWFPPPSKGQSGGFSAGYDIYDYYDLGAFNQMGSTGTRFGLQA